MVKLCMFTHRWISYFGIKNRLQNMVTKSLILLLNYFYRIIYYKFQPQGNYSQTFIYVVTFIKTRFFSA